MGVFDDFSEHNASGGGKWYQEGVYLVQLVAMPLLQSSNDKGLLVPIEATILELRVEYPAGRVCEIDGKPLPASNIAGERVSDVLLLERQKPAKANLKSAILAFCQMNEVQVVEVYAEQHGLSVDDPATAKAAWKAFGENATAGEGTMLAGAIAVVRAQRVRKKNGDPFTKKVYEAADAEDWEKYVHGPARVAAEAAAPAPAEGAAA